MIFQNYIAPVIDVGRRPLRRRRIWGLFATWCAIGLLVPAVSHAGTYVINNCPSAPAG